MLGFEPCADYKLATYEAIDTYLRALDAASDRMTLVEIGRSVEGRPLRLAVISSPRNLARLEHYRGIAATLALGRRDGRVLTDDVGARAGAGRPRRRVGGLRPALLGGRARAGGAAVRRGGWCRARPTRFAGCATT